MRRLHRRRPTMGLPQIRHLHLPRVRRDPPRVRRARLFRAVRTNGLLQGQRGAAHGGGGRERGLEKVLGRA